MNNGRPTLKDVAEKSGYALRTVKKVLSGDPSVLEKTRISVLAAAKELHYTRNRAASALALNRTIRIAVVYSVTSEAYFPEVEAGFKEAEREFVDFGLKLEYHIGYQDGWEQQQTVLKALQERDDINGIIIQPSSTIHLNTQIDETVACGKPVITFGADAPDSKRLCYVGPDAYKAGRIGGQILANYIGKQGRVWVINQMGDHMQTRERSRGFVDRIQEHYPNIEVFIEDLPRDNADFYGCVKRIIQEERVTGLFCTDANTVIAGRVLRDLGASSISLVGFDLSHDGVQLMRDGFINVIIEQKPETFSKLATVLLYHYIVDGTKPCSINNTPLYIMTSECLD